MKPKPIPPKNLWEMLDADYQQHKAPEDTFTAKQYCERFGATNMMARTVIDRLIKHGVVEFVGKYGAKAENHYRLKG